MKIVIDNIFSDKDQKEVISSIVKSILNFPEENQMFTKNICLLSEIICSEVSAEMNK